MKFRGFSSPRTTPTPDEFYDRVLAKIDNLAELKVVLYVIRHTFGWGKFIDRISLSQFVRGVTRRSIIHEGDRLKHVEVQVDRGTGLSEPAVIQGLRRAVEHGYLVRYMVCGRCQQEIFEAKPPAKCPHCQEPYRGRQQHYYSLSLLSTELSTLPKELRVEYLRGLGGTPKGFLGVLLNVLKAQETTEQETYKQETSIQETDNKQLVAVVGLLSGFGFKSADSQAIAEEALEAGLTAEDVEAWIEYVGRQGNLTNPKGFLRAKVRSCERPPSTEEDDRYRYISGKYAEYIKH
jgi:hypothetical protein